MTFLGRHQMSSVETVREELSRVVETVVTSSNKPPLTLKVNDTVLMVDVDNVTSEMAPLCPSGSMQASNTDSCGKSITK